MSLVAGPHEVLRPHGTTLPQVELGVEETRAVVEPGGELHLVEGSRLALHCSVDLGRGPDR